MKKTIFVLSLISCAILTLASCNHESWTMAINEKQGIEYYKKGEYQNAFPLLEKAANSGSVKASYYIGEMYRKGKGVAENNALACRNYVKSAEGKYRNAFLLAGACYIMGKGVKQDFNEGYKWLKSTAYELNRLDLNLTDKKYVMLTLANLSLSGKGTLQDFSESAKWARKAAELGDAEAQGLLSFFLYSGQGVLENKTEAKYWAEKSAEQKHPEGQMMLGMLYQYPPVEQKPDIPEAIKWYKKASERGVHISTLRLAQIYETGEGINRDLKKAYQYYRLAAKQGNNEAIEKIRELEKKNLHSQ